MIFFRISIIFEFLIDKTFRNINCFKRLKMNHAFNKNKTINKIICKVLFCEREINKPKNIVRFIINIALKFNKLSSFIIKGLYFS